MIGWNSPPSNPVTATFHSEQRKATSRDLVAFLFPFLYGGSDHRPVTGYLSPSNHLLMRWQTTPAITATIKDMNTSYKINSYTNV